jgi:hypothetical protein
MTTRYGTQFSATDPLKKANGTSHNSPIKAFKNKFALATEGGTVGPYKIASIGIGHVIDEFKLDTDANLSAINFTIGTLAAPAKYRAATAGPNAAVVVWQPLLANDIEASTVAEDIYLFASANMPGAGSLKTTVTTIAR